MPDAPRLLTAAALAAALSAPAPAPAQQPPGAEQAVQCLIAYRTGMQVQAMGVFDETWPPDGGGEESYSQRIYRAAQAAGRNTGDDIYDALLDRLGHLSDEQFTRDTGLEISSIESDLFALQQEIASCDAALGVNAAMASVTTADWDCAVRYAALAQSLTDPGPTQYFTQRAQLAMATDATFLEQPAIDPEDVARLEQESRARAEKNFANGQPDFASLNGQFTLARECDAKYGLPLTEIPQEIAQNARR